MRNDVLIFGNGFRFEHPVAHLGGYVQIYITVWPCSNSQSNSFNYGLYFYVTQWSLSDIDIGNVLEKVFVLLDEANTVLKG